MCWCRVQVGILSTLRHPNVVLFMGVCLSPPAVVTEYCPLRSLYDVLKKVGCGSGRPGSLHDIAVDLECFASCCFGCFALSA
jgi:hypothetical protein